MKKGFFTLILLIAQFSVTAVNISQTGYGQAIILPYFTVNNNLHTLISINNSTDDIKALKLHFREGKEGKAVLSFNLYLAPQDIWAAGVLPQTSTIPGHEGESSAYLISGDSSCTPFLPTLGQPFLPYEIEAESEDTNMQRAREGYIEIIEMGVVDPSSELAQAMTFALNAEAPRNCAAIETAFINGVWSTENDFQTTDMMPVSGGIAATASIIDINEGVMFPVNSIAFEHFFPENSIFHTMTGDTRIPSLEHAETTSQLIFDGQAILSEWDHGYQAINALLSKSRLESLYDLYEPVVARSEMTLTFPTKRFHQSDEAPFGISEINETEGCISFDSSVYDRNGQAFCSPYYGCGPLTEKLTPLPPEIQPVLCRGVNTLAFFEFGSINDEQPTTILGGDYFTARNVLAYESGKMIFGFNQTTTSNNGHTYTGLPVTGMTFQKYTNAGAAAGLLAQYGGTSPLSYKVNITVDE